MSRRDFEIVFILLASLIVQKGNAIDLSFPDDFMFGTASSAYQVEGAWNHSDKSESLWDNYVHKYPERITNHSTGDVACDSFNKYKEDVQLLRDLGVNHYRFSLSWSRVLPTGYTDKISQEGVKYYHNLIDELLKYNITPIITIYHLEHPQSLEKFGGWLNESMAYVFADYARFVFQEFGHKVKYFVTLNEIKIRCSFGYEEGTYAPGMNLTGVGEYVCVHNSLKAHALAYHIYDKEFRKKQNGLIGLTELVSSFYNKDKNETDAEDIAHAFMNGLTLDPIFSRKGNYPEIVIRKVAERSRLQGLNSSRLPTFSKKWINYIRGTADFLGLNHYVSVKVKHLPQKNPLDWPYDSGLEEFFDPAWPPTEFPPNKVFPKGFGDALRKVRDDYNNPPVYVLENGVAASGGLNDTLREEYLYSYLKEMLTAIKRDKCNVKMYTYWSLLDSFEWLNGYSMHFGLAAVDYNSKNRTRTMKNSAVWFKSVLKSRKLQLPTSWKQ